jgi:hypothetical protein
MQGNSSSTSSGSTATGVYGLLSPAAAAVAAAGVGLSGQKRRMVTTESPALSAGLSAPAKLQRGQLGLGLAVLSEVQQRWVAAAEMEVNA